MLVACSGGAGLARARPPPPVPCATVRAPSSSTTGCSPGSAAVAARTAAWLQGSGLEPVDVVQVTVVEAGDGPEAAARDARYRALFRAAREHGAEAVLLGHTLDDQAETVLLGLARGSGARSLAGMPRSRGPFRRPLLAPAARRRPGRGAARARPSSTTRTTTTTASPAAGCATGCCPCSRPSSAPASPRRSPAPPTSPRADADALAELADEVAWDVIHGARDEGTLDVVDLEPLSDAVRSRVVRQWLLDGGLPGRSAGLDHVQRVCRLVTEWTGQGAVALPGGVEAVRDYGRLALRQTTLPRKEP